MVEKTMSPSPMRFSWIHGILLIVGCGSVGGIWALQAGGQQQRFRPQQVVSPFDPITKFDTKTAEQIGDQLNPDELVLGVTVGGEARAYPINMLTGPSREIINDQLDGTPIAATW